MSFVQNLWKNSTGLPKSYRFWYFKKNLCVYKLLKKLFDLGGYAISFDFVILHEIFKLCPSTFLICFEISQRALSKSPLRHFLKKMFQNVKFMKCHKKYSKCCLYLQFSKGGSQKDHPLPKWSRIHWSFRRCTIVIFLSNMANTA